MSPRHGGHGIRPDDDPRRRAVLPRVRHPGNAIVKGDATVPQIMAASILAKTARDAWMEEYALQEPDYLFEKHKGYPTAEHRRIVLPDRALRGYSAELSGSAPLDVLHRGVEAVQKDGKVLLEDDHRPPLELILAVSSCSPRYSEKHPRGGSLSR